MKPYNTERLVRGKLGEMFGTKFKKAKLIIGYDSKKLPLIHEFDLISERKDIIGEIKSGKCSRENYKLALVDCMYLSKIRARMKLMVFTEKKLYEYFKEKSEGLISSDIRAILLEPDVPLETTIS
jgi:hypothetical protein